MKPPGRRSAARAVKSLSHFDSRRKPHLRYRAKALKPRLCRQRFEVLLGPFFFQEEGSAVSSHSGAPPERLSLSSSRMSWGSHSARLFSRLLGSAART